MKKMLLVTVLALLAACNTTPPELDGHVHEDPVLGTTLAAVGSNPGLSHTFGGPTPNAHRSVSLARKLTRTYSAGSRIPAGSTLEIDLGNYHYLTSLRVSVGPNSILFPIACQWVDAIATNLASKMRCDSASKIGATYTVRVDEQNTSGTWVNVLYNTYTVDASLQP